MKKKAFTFRESISIKDIEKPIIFDFIADNSIPGVVIPGYTVHTYDPKFVFHLDIETTGSGRFEFSYEMGLPERLSNDKNLLDKLNKVILERDNNI